MRWTATQASRGFSELLSRVAAGETVEIDRHGQVVAVVRPPERRTVSGTELADLLTALPVPDNRLADDVRELGAVTRQPALPWQS